MPTNSATNPKQGTTDNLSYSVFVCGDSHKTYDTGIYIHTKRCPYMITGILIKKIVKRNICRTKKKAIGMAAGHSVTFFCRLVRPSYL